MPIQMKNPRFPHGQANVKSRDVSTWEAAGWAAVPEPKPTKKKGEDK